MTEKYETISFRRRWKKRLRRFLRLELESMLSEIGKRVCSGPALMLPLDDTFEIGLPDGTLVKVRATTKIVVTPISGTQPRTSPSLSPTKAATSVKRTARPSNPHKTRFSDSSLYDEKCVYCGATDGFGDKRLSKPCPNSGGAEKY